VEPEPHRALIDAALRDAERRAQWGAEDGPVPEQPADWTMLWRSAVARHVALTGQSELDSRVAVTGIVNQVVALYHEMAWFRQDDRLRERAVAETLIAGTGLSERVASAAAQAAWRGRWTVVQQEWQLAWHEWADRAAR
jgi:hypothetical protein